MSVPWKQNGPDLNGFFNQMHNYEVPEGALAIWGIEYERWVHNYLEGEMKNMDWKGCDHCSIVMERGIPWKKVKDNHELFTGLHSIGENELLIWSPDFADWLWEYVKDDNDWKECWHCKVILNDILETSEG